MTDSEPSDLDAHALIELYFESEDDNERDVLLDKLEAIDLPVVTEFFRAAASEDDDELVQVRALGVLARRGDDDAKAALHCVVDDPADTLVFEEALRGLVAVEGAAYFATLLELWRGERSPDERRVAMVVMEQLDATRTLEHYRELIATLGDAAHFPDDQVEVMMLAFVRHDDASALPLLEGLLTRLSASSAEMDAEERNELLGMVREGIDLLRG